MASKFIDEPNRALRFSDIQQEPRRRLPPIKGYEEKELVSLEEATNPLLQLVPDIQHMVWTVKDGRTDSIDGITAEELAALKLYTMDWASTDKSFYTALNRTLRAADREKLKPWFLYLRLVLTGLFQLPSRRRTIFRGVKMDLRDDYPEGSTFIWWGFTSCTSTAKLLEQDRFLGKKGVRTLFTIDCYTGKDIRKYSFYPDEDEILLLPGRQFKVVSCLDSGNTLYMIHIEETEPPFPLLSQIPSRKLTTGFDPGRIAVDENNETNQNAVFTSNDDKMKRKMIKFVEESFYKFGRAQQRIQINLVEAVVNSRLKARFERCKQTLGHMNVMTLLHGTKLEFARGIASEGFHIPTSFKRNPDNDAEGELKFGKALYFAYGKKATEYGKNILVVADCNLGKVQKKQTSELKLTPEIVHKRGYHTIHYENNQEGLVNQEWAIYRTDQCLPLYIIHYEIIDESDHIENAVIDCIRAMNILAPDYALFQQALFGTDNQCKAVLKFIGDLAHQSTHQSRLIMQTLLMQLNKNSVNCLLRHPNETVRILFLRALWLTGRGHQKFQLFLYNHIGSDTIIESLVSGYDDVCWRACGVLANMAASVQAIRHLLVTTQILQHLMLLLQRGLESQDKLCILTVVNLLANVTCSEYMIMKEKTDIQQFLNETLMDHPDTDVQEAANRFFCNIIGKGTVTADWKRAGYRDTASAPELE